MVVIAVLKVELSVGEFSSGPLTFLLGLLLAYLSSSCFVVKGDVFTQIRIRFLYLKVGGEKVVWGLILPPKFEEEI